MLHGSGCHPPSGRNDDQGQIVEGDVRTDEEAQDWVNGQDHELLIDILWKIGFLRAQAVGGVKAMRRSGSSYLGPHQVGNLNLAALSRFQVHGPNRFTVVI